MGQIKISKNFDPTQVLQNATHRRTEAMSVSEKTALHVSPKLAWRFNQSRRFSSLKWMHCKIVRVQPDRCRKYNRASSECIVHTVRLQKTYVTARVGLKRRQQAMPSQKSIVLMAPKWPQFDTDCVLTLRRME